MWSFDWGVPSWTDLENELYHSILEECEKLTAISKTSKKERKYYDQRNWHRKF